MDMGRGPTEYLGFDLDGVLVPWHERVTKYGIENLGWPKNTISADVFKPKTKDGLFDVLPHEEQSRIARMKEFYVGEPIDKDILSMLKFLARFYKLVYITSRPSGEVHDATRYWFVKNQLPYLTNLHIVDNGSKKEFAKKCKFFVDDRVDVALDLADVTTVVTVDQPWNRHLDTSNRIKTIFDLPKFLEAYNGRTAEFES
jgi:hypothetical protein